MILSRRGVNGMENFEVNVELLPEEELEEVKSYTYFFVGSDIFGPWPF